MMEELRAISPAARTELALVERCGSQLAEVLRGAVDPLRLLFPEEGSITAADLYQDSPAALAINGLVRQVMALTAGRLPPERGLRVLEIGAGTGGMTAHLLPEFPADRTEYLFTDISGFFTAQARERFHGTGFIDYRPLDIEDVSRIHLRGRLEAAAQGFNLGADLGDLEPQVVAYVLGNSHYQSMPPR